MRQFLMKYRTVLLCTVSGLFGLVLAFNFDNIFGSASAQTKKPGAAAEKPAANSEKPIVSPPPADVNDLAMEVAALRTLYLFKCGPELAGERISIPGYKMGLLVRIRDKAKDCAQKPRQRAEAGVSKEYVNVLTDLRAAFIACQVDRINELSEQLEELADSEDVDFDDTVEITDLARKNGPQVLKWFPPDVIVSYLSAYGKEFPDPWLLMWKTMRLDGKGTKPSKEEWKIRCDAVIKEVSWQVGGLDVNQQKKGADEAAKLLDKAYSLSNEQLKKHGMGGDGSLRVDLFKLITHASATDPLKHVLQQDLAELLSNPRLIPAINARVEYLKLGKTEVKNPELE